MNCNDAATMVAAYADGETDALQNRLIKRHLAACPKCAAKHDELLALRTQIRAEVPRFSASPALRARVLATLEASRPVGSERSRPIVDAWHRLTGGARAAVVRTSGSAQAQPMVDRWRWLTGGALAGCAATMLSWFVGTAVLDWRTSQDLAVEAVTSHVRATLGNQMIQVVSSDQHTVKPWLSARLDYSPPVRDMAPEGFTLAGGRVDYLDRHAVATLVYQYRNHMVDVFVRPESARAPPAMLRSVRGFNVVNATGSGMEWVAVSDVSADVLSAFIQKCAREAGAP